MKSPKHFKHNTFLYSRYLTQPTDITSEKTPESPRRIKYAGRHKTQPITPEEKREAETGNASNSSIKDRYVYNIVHYVRQAMHPITASKMGMYTILCIM